MTMSWLCQDRETEYPGIHGARFPTRRRVETSCYLHGPRFRRDVDLYDRSTTAYLYLVLLSDHDCDCDRSDSR